MGKLLKAAGFFVIPTVDFPGKAPSELASKAAARLLEFGLFRAKTIKIYTVPKSKVLWTANAIEAVKGSGEAITVYFKHAFDHTNPNDSFAEMYQEALLSSGVGLGDANLYVSDTAFTGNRDVRNKISLLFKFLLSLLVEKHGIPYVAVKDPARAPRYAGGVPLNG